MGCDYDGPRIDRYPHKQHDGYYYHSYGSQEGWTCDECGAFVRNTDVHNDWHTRLNTTLGLTSRIG